MFDHQKKFCRTHRHSCSTATLIRWVASLFILGVLPYQFAQAAPYPPEGLQTQWQQPDGTLLNLRVFGDEFYARTETKSGYTVVFNQAEGAYYYAETASRSKSLQFSAVQAHFPPPAGLPKHILEPSAHRAAVRNANVKTYAPDRSARWERRKKAVTGQRQRAALLMQGIDLPLSPMSAQELAVEAAAAAPLSGDKVGLEILVQFPDDPATPAMDPVDFPVTQAKMERFSNEVGYIDDGNTGSIRDYFYDQSGGQLTHTQLVSVVITLPNPRNYYNFSDYPANTLLASSGLAGRRLVEDALTLMEAGGFDFSSLSVDGGNTVYATSLFFAGANSGVWAQGLWPHAGSLAVARDVGSPGSPRYILRYQITNVANATPSIGVACHELGHLLLGYPDFYDTDSADGASEGVGEHSLMGTGLYLNGGSTPAPIGLYLKDFSGWANITDLTPGIPVQLSLPSTGNVGYRLRKPATPAEYFLVENRGLGDKWAEYTRDQGILIWHVDEAVTTDNQRQQMTPTQHYELSVEQADGLFNLELNQNRGDPGDLFDSASPSFNDITEPDATWWSGGASGLALEVLSAPGSSMDVLFFDPISWTLTDALDTKGTGLSWNDDGSWFGEFSIDSHDGLDAARSKVIGHSESTSLHTNVTGPGTLTFWWKVSSETNYDYLRFYVNETEQPEAIAISGSPGWQQVTMTIPSGLHSLRWTYSKDASVSTAMDAGWIDEVLFVPTLANALDTVNVNWTEDNSWFGELNEISVDGIDDARSSAIADSEVTSLQATIVGPGPLTFWWRVSSEQDYDFLQFYLDDIQQPAAPQISGSVAWQQKSIAIPAGIHTVRWTYSKDSSVSAGDDAAWVDRIVYTSPGLDSDADGISDADELFLGTDPYNVDSDGDGLVDGAGGVVLLSNYSAGIDIDDDGYVDGEAELGTDPTASNVGDLAPLGKPDNDINIGDLLIMARMMSGAITPAPIEAVLADVNGDGLLDMADLLFLQQQLLAGPDS